MLGSGQGLGGALSQSSLGRGPSSPTTRCYVSLRGNRREAARSFLQGVMLSPVTVSITSVSLEGHTKKLLETKRRADSSSTPHHNGHPFQFNVPFALEHPKSSLVRATLEFLALSSQTNNVLFGFCDGAIVAALAERSH